MLSLRARILTLVLCSAPLLVIGQVSEFDFLPDHPGKAAATLELPQSAHYRLSAAERTTVLSELTRLRDRLFAQPFFNPPHGIEVRGVIGAHGGSPSSLNPSVGLLKEPVQAFGTLYYCFYYRDRKDGKPHFNPFSTWELQVAVNNPVEFGPEPFRGANDSASYLRQPRKVAELQGFPLYRNGDGSEFIVISRTGRPYWRPVTREEYLKYWINYLEGVIAERGQIPQLNEMLRRSKKVFAQMSPEERQMQARHATYTDSSEPPLDAGPYEPPLSPVGSKQGVLLIAVNPEWYDPSLPRTAFQLITVRCLYRGDLDPDDPQPTETGMITALRLWETLHKSDWKAIGGVLFQ